MITSTGEVDGSWDLNIEVPRFGVTKTIKVRGELHIGGLLLRLSESFDKDEKEDWSDYALWWVDRNLWLLRTRSTLDQCGVQGSSQLEFTQMHQDLNILMPDLRILKMRTNFSVSVFRVVMQLCKALKLRHPEEMSLSRKLDASEMKKNHGISAVRRAKVPGLSQMQQMQQTASVGGRNNSLFPNGSDTSGYRSGSITPEGTLERGLFMTTGAVTPFDVGGATMSLSSLDALSVTETDLSQSPTISMDEAMKSKLYCPKNYVEKARINAGWFDSSRSLMEQGIRGDDVVLLRYKYFNFYDLNKKQDKTRINQLYQQAKWSILSGEINCTEEEMLVFAALQVQVEKEMQKLQFISEVDDEDENDVGNGGGVDAALDCLQFSLEGTSGQKQHGHITKTPQLRDYLQLCRSKAFGMKSYKQLYFVLKDVHLSVYKDENEADPMMKFNLKESELSQVVNLAREEFDLKLLVHENDLPKEVTIRLDTTEKYARWSVAIKMAAKGRTMADSSYDSEVSSLRSILDLRRMQLTKQLNESASAASPSFDPRSCVAPRFFKGLTVQQAKNRIVAVHSKVSTMKLRDAELEYIRAWQMLPEYGNTYFIVKFSDRKKEELLAISTDHMTRMDIHTGDPTKTWNYTTVENWSVNWDTRHVHLSINGRDHALQCYTADCKVIHEFIGGYIFLSLRSPEKSQTLDEEYFQKLTGGRD